MLTGPQFSADAAAANLRKGLEETRTRIASAALRCGRDPASVGLVAITKGQPASMIRAAAELGQCDFGENYLQEAIPKLASLSDLPLQWHYTGQIQSNKTRPIAERFAWVHTVDRERVAVRLSEQRPYHAPPLNICVQVRLADEPGKAGVRPEEVLDLVRRVSTLPDWRFEDSCASRRPPRTSKCSRRRFARSPHALLESMPKVMHSTPSRWGCPRTSKLRSLAALPGYESARRFSVRATPEMTDPAFLLSDRRRGHSCKQPSASGCRLAIGYPAPP